MTAAAIRAAVLAALQPAEELGGPSLAEYQDLMAWVVQVASDRAAAAREVSVVVCERNGCSCDLCHREVALATVLLNLDATRDHDLSNTAVADLAHDLVRAGAFLVV